MKKGFVFIFLILFAAKAFSGEISISLDEYLTSKGVTKEQNSGHINTTPTYDAKAQYFTALLQANPNVRTIVEIGFCLGHSSDVFLSARPDIKVVSFDLMSHWYNDEGKSYIDMKYPGKHKLFRGDSLRTVPAFIRKNPRLVFDLILIDGGHEYEVALKDIINMQQLAGPNTIVIMDDTEYEPVARAWKECVANGLVEEFERRADSGFGWTRGRYLKYGKLHK